MKTVNDILVELQEEYNAKKEKEQNKETNPDWWLHMHDKYTIEDLLTCEVIILHKYERTEDKHYQLRFWNKVKEYAHYYDLSGSSLTDILSELSKAEIEHSVIDRNQGKTVTIDFANDVHPDMLFVVGIGGLCMSGIPCCHMLVVEDATGAEVTIKYVRADQIKEIYDHTGQPQRKHITDQLAWIDRMEQERKAAEKAEEEGIPQVFCLCKEQPGEYSEYEVLMTTDSREKCLQATAQYALWYAREGVIFDDMLEIRSFYEDYEKTVPDVVNGYIEEAQKYGESSGICDGLSFWPNNDIMIVMRRIPVDPELSPERLMEKHVPARAIAAKECDNPYRWYLEALATECFDIPNPKDLSYNDLLVQVGKNYNEGIMEFIPQNASTEGTEGT